MTNIQRTGKRIWLFIIFPEMNFRAKSQSRPSVGLGSEPWTSVRGNPTGQVAYGCMKSARILGL